MATDNATDNADAQPPAKAADMDREAFIKRHEITDTNGCLRGPKSVREAVMRKVRRLYGHRPTAERAGVADYAISDAFLAGKKGYLQSSVGRAVTDRYYGVLADAEAAGYAERDPRSHMETFEAEQKRKREERRRDRRAARRGEPAFEAGQRVAYRRDGERYAGIIEHPQYFPSRESWAYRIEEASAPYVPEDKILHVIDG